MMSISKICSCPRLIMRSANYCLLYRLITVSCLMFSRLPLLSPVLTLSPRPAPSPSSCPLLPPPATIPTYNYYYCYLTTTMYHMEGVKLDVI